MNVLVALSVLGLRRGANASTARRACLRLLEKHPSECANASSRLEPRSSRSPSLLGFVVFLGLSVLHCMAMTQRSRADTPDLYRYADAAWKELIETHARGRDQFNQVCALGDEKLCEASKAWSLGVSGECAQLQKEAKTFARIFARSKAKEAFGGDYVVAYVDAYTIWICSQSAPAQAKDSGWTPLPGEWKSHEAYVALLGAARERARANLLGRYDAHLAEHPNDVVASVERCGFIADTQEEVDEWDEETQSLELADCTAQLANDFPHEEKAITFRLTHAWGDERVALAEQTLKDPAVRWTQLTRARALLLYAEALAFMGQTKKAARAAKEAMTAHSGVDGSLFIANYLVEKGRNQDAISVLRHQLARTETPAALLNKARLLDQLAAYDAALEALELVRAQDPTLVDVRLHAHVLAGLGHTQQARERYAEAGQGWNRPRVLRELFELDLNSGRDEQALASYRALRDEGFEADPLLRQRVRLFARFPTLPWQARDVWGGLYLLLLLVAASLAPALVFVPVHYLGLILRQGRAPHAPSQWTLRRAWGVCAAWLVADCFAAYFFMYEGIEDWMGTAAEVPPDSADLAKLGLATCFAGLPVLVAARCALARTHHPCAWRPKQFAREVLRAVLITSAIAFVYMAIVKGLGLYELLAGDTPPAVTTQTNTMAIMRATARHYGLPGVALLAMFAAPLVEELLFRVVLLDAFERHLPIKLATLVQATAFAVLHDNWIAWPVLLLVGVQAARLRRRSGSIHASIAFHAVWNTFPTLMIWLATRGPH
jgi:membrane protease YdiL (CAAX protease family)/predicted negative regulator of RcsB-dependent stress response